MTSILCLSSWHGVGGAQMNAAMLVGEFQRRGLDAKLVFLFGRENVSFEGVSSIVLYPRRPRGLRDWFVFLNNFKNLLIQTKPSVIFGFHPLSNVLGASFSLFLKNCKFVGTQRNPSESQGKVLRVLDGFLGSYLYHSNICVSQSVADSYSKYPKPYIEKIKVVHNGTPKLEKFSGSVLDAKERFSMNGHCIGFIGRLHDQKNVEFLIRLMPMLPNVKIYIAGDGPEKNHLVILAEELGVSEKIHFLGALSGSDITCFYKAIDILMMPSKFEGFGRVLVEALSAGTLVFANKIPVLKEVSSDSAVLLELDVNIWANEVNCFFHNPNYYIDYKKRGVLRSQFFSIENMVDKYLLEAEVND